MDDTLNPFRPSRINTSSSTSVKSSSSKDIDSLATPFPGYVDMIYVQIYTLTNNII